MANHLKVAVKETREELRHRLKRAITAHTKERLQMLYWIKTGVVSTRAELAQRLERDESTLVPRREPLGTQNYYGSANYSIWSEATRTRELAT